MHISRRDACARARTPVRMRPCARARARTRAPSFVPPSRTALHLNCLFILPASAPPFPPYPTPSRAARSRPRASIPHCAGLQGCEPNTSPPPSPTCYARAIPRHLMTSGCSPLTMSGKALVSMRLVGQTDGASLTRRRARRRRRYGWTRKATLRTTALPTQIKAWCGVASAVRLKGLAVVPSPSLELPLLPPRPDVYARQHSLTRQADCLCVRCVARPCLCVCVGRKRRCSQALSTCSPFLPRSVPLARACPRAPRLRSINPSSPLPPHDRLSAHLSRSLSAPLARDSVLVSPSSCPPPPSHLQFARVAPTQRSSSRLSLLHWLPTMDAWRVVWWGGVVVRWWLNGGGWWGRGRCWRTESLEHTLTGSFGSSPPPQLLS